MNNIKLQDRQFTYNTEARSRNHCCSGKAISITYFCVRASVQPYFTDHTKRMRSIILFLMNSKISKKKTQMSNFIKILQLEPSYAIRTDRYDKAKSRFSQTCERG
jgi:hypothetical protein